MKGECIIQYVYRPYHGWRHGYRREKWRKWMLRIAKWLLAAEGMVLAARYVQEHTYTKMYEREMIWDETMSWDSERSGRIESNGDGEFYGIGFEPEDGSVFWFHKRTENTDKQ